LLPRSISAPNDTRTDIFLCTSKANELSNVVKTVQSDEHVDRFGSHTLHVIAQC